MKAIILVAGYATRLYPLTKDKPKALLKLDDKPIIEYIIEEINTIDEINEIIIVSNDAFFNHFERWKKTYDNDDLDKPITVINDMTKSVEGRLGAIGDIKFTIDKLKIDESIMVLAGDNFFTFPMKEYYNLHKSLDKDMICVKEMNEDEEDIRRFAVALLDDNGKVTHLREKPEEPKSNIAAYAVYLYKKDTLPLFKEFIDGGNNPDSPGYFVEWLYKRKELYAYEMNGDCFDIGTIEAYDEVNKYVIELNKQKNN